jgi:ribosomal protein S18 acetylase RimI-like enzyme
MSASFIIRPATAADRLELRKAVVELQDFEHRLHTTRLPGEMIADTYLDWMLGQAEANGAVLLAESDGSFVGFVAGWIETTENVGETLESNRFGYISDICVLPAFRGRRIASRLLAGIEQYLHCAGVVHLRINALAVNTSARTSYQHAGFAPYEILYEKLIRDQTDK